MPRSTQDFPRNSPSADLIRHQDGTALAGLIVRAFDKDLRSEELLGAATSNADGHYQVIYTPDKFARSEKKIADLIVRAFSPEGLQLAESSILFNAPVAATINLTVTPLPPVTVSEYEQLVADVAPVLDGVSIADMTDQNIAFLAGDTGDPPDRITFVRLAAQLSRQTTVPTESLRLVPRGSSDGSRRPARIGPASLARGVGQGHCRRDRSGESWPLARRHHAAGRPAQARARRPPPIAAASTRTIARPADRRAA